MPAADRSTVLLLACLLLVGCGEAPEPTVPEQFVVDSEVSVTNECLGRCFDAARDACKPLTGIAMRACDCSGDSGWLSFSFTCHEVETYYTGSGLPENP